MTIESGKYKAVITKPWEKKWHIVYFKKDGIFANSGWKQVSTSHYMYDGYVTMKDLVEFTGTKRGAIRKATRRMKGWTDRDTHDDQRFEVFSK